MLMVSEWEEWERYLKSSSGNKIKLVYSELIDTNFKIESAWSEIPEQNREETNLKV